MTESDGIVTTANGTAGNIITPKIEKWFEKRGIDPETISNCGIYTEGDENNPVVVFPSFENGAIVNRKYRGRDKKFWQQEGGKKTFYNLSGLELAIVENKPLVICEGEMDCLSVIQARYAWVVSIPDGAPAKEMEFEGIENDNKFKFIWNHKVLLDKVETIILAGDKDEPGRVLNHELSKRLGLDRCKYITYPDDCKDFNDVLVKHGASKINELINKAKNYPVVGLYKPDEFPPLPQEYKQPYHTGFGHEHDYHLKLMLGKLMVITGIPGHGKSEYADALCMNLAKKYNWNICVCSTEINNEEYEENSIRRYLRRPLDLVGEHEPAKAKQFYQDHFSFITNATMDNEIELTLEKLIELAEIAILRDGCKVVMLDPWNEIEHARMNRETETEYTNRAIRQLKLLAKIYKVLVIVVAHPKMPEQGKLKCPSLYSISGSAHWFNKADYGIIIWRDDPSGDESQVRIAKIKRHGAMGKPGNIKVKLNKHTANFEEI